MANGENNGIWVGRNKVFINSGLVLAVVALIANTVLQVQNKITTVTMQTAYASAESVENIKEQMREVETNRKIMELRLNSIDVEMKRMSTNQDAVMRSLEKITVTMENIRDLVIKHMLETPKNNP